jgi:hypothetical protein
MRADLWKALLRRIPPEQTDNLVLVMGQGTEINVQALLLVDEHWVVLRGRLAGSNDGGRIFCLPYDHLNHAGFQRAPSDSHLHTIFNIAMPAEPVPSPAEPAAAAPAPEPAPAVTPQPETGTPSPGLMARVPTRSKIIQRLRMRAEAREGANTSTKE